MKLVPDTSAVIDGRVSERIADGSYKEATVLVPEAVVGELESQANAGYDSGWNGLEELQTLTGYADEREIELEYVGRRASGSEQAGASEGDVDAIIRDVAEDHEATLLSSDTVQSEVAKAKGLDVEYVEPEVHSDEDLPIAPFFDEETMSVHLKTDTKPKAKRGALSGMSYKVIDETVTSDEQIDEWADEIESLARTSREGFVELSEPGMTIVQYQDYRIAVARPPFADGIEITAVRPIVKTTLEDYEFADDLRERLLERQRGVLISGAPGAVSRPLRRQLRSSSTTTTTPSRRWRNPGTCRSARRLPSTPPSAAIWQTLPTHYCLSDPTIRSTTKSEKPRTSASSRTCDSRASGWSVSSTPRAPSMPSSDSSAASSWG